MSEQVHMCEVEPYKKWITLLILSCNEIRGRFNKFIIAGFHSFFIQWTCVFYFLLANLSPTWHYSGIIFVGCPGMKDTPGPESLLELWIFGIVSHFGFFFCIKMIKIAKEFIEAMIGRQHVIEITQMIF